MVVGEIVFFYDECWGFGGVVLFDGKFFEV